MKEQLDKIKELKKRIKDLKSNIDFNSKKEEITSLEERMNTPNFWGNQDEATMVSQKVAALKEEITNWKDIDTGIKDMYDLAKEDEDIDLNDEYEILNSKFNKLEILTVLNNKYDDSNAILSIYAGTGGVDAQDWAEMLLRMYLRYAEKKDFKVKTLDKSKGTEAGIKSVTLEIKGRYAYGFLKSESGVHRLVRLSPYDSDNARHTSFAMVEIIPEIEVDSDFEIKDDDLKVDTFKASGHGGQSVNTTDSAVRITHLPTKITVTCQNERSQHQNKDTALKYLRGKLIKYNETKVEAERQRLRGEFTEAAWGNQIRSYVLHPYKMVKDHRTKYEEKDPERVLDGEIDKYIEEYLKSQIE
ncbi:peptide chain release factor 2 [bacterium]|nr:peptide chain release factor 2 [bacterium]